MRSIITLAGIDEAISSLRYSEKALKYKLIQTIRSFYIDETSIDSIEEVPPDELIQQLWDTGHDPIAIKNRRKNLSSIKSSINADLNRLHEGGNNSEGIIIGPTNVFDMSYEAKTKILERFTYDPMGESSVPLTQIMDVLKTVNEILSMPVDDDGDSEIDGLKKLDQLKELIKSLSKKVGIGGPGQSPAIVETGKESGSVAAEIIAGHDEGESEGVNAERIKPHVDFADTEDDLEEIEFEEDLEEIDIRKDMDMEEDLEEVDDEDDLEEAVLEEGFEAEEYVKEPDDEAGLEKMMGEDEDETTFEVDPDEVVEEEAAPEEDFEAIELNQDLEEEDLVDEPVEEEIIEEAEIEDDSESQDIEEEEPGEYVGEAYEAEDFMVGEAEGRTGQEIDEDLEDVDLQEDVEEEDIVEEIDVEEEDEDDPDINEDLKDASLEEALEDEFLEDADIEEDPDILDVEDDPEETEREDASETSEIIEEAQFDEDFDSFEDDDDLEESALEEEPEEVIDEIEAPEEDLEELDIDDDLEGAPFEDTHEEEEVIDAEDIEDAPEILDMDEELEEVDIPEEPELDEAIRDTDELEELEIGEDLEDVKSTEDPEIEEVIEGPEVEEDLQELDDEDLEEVTLDEELKADEAIEESLIEDDLELLEDDDLEEVDMAWEPEVEAELEEPEEEIVDEIEAPGEDLEELDIDDDLEEVPLEGEHEAEEVIDDEDIEDDLEILDKDEELEEVILEEGMDGLNVSLGDLLEDYSDEGFIGEDGVKKAKFLAEGFNNALAAMDKYYNQYILVSAGDYIVGAKSSENGERPEKKIHLESFYFGKFPVTNALFEIFMEKTGYKTTAEKLGYGIVYHGRYQRVIDERTGLETFNWRSALSSDRVEGACWYQPSGPGSTLHNKRNHPVVQVSREDAMAFAAWTGKRLPTEDEWEAAARTAKGHEFPWGKESNPAFCNIEESYIGSTTPVDQYKKYANEFGIADTIGNILEWTIDLLIPSTGQVGQQMVYPFRGGSWISGRDVRLSSRILPGSETHSNIIGFRCVAY